MAEIKPFKALRPRPDLAPKICELPYDVMSSAEAKAMAEGNEYSFLRVSKPEIDLPEGTDVYSDAVYAKGAENLQKMISAGHLIQDEAPGYYVYRLIMNGRPQVGIVGAAGCQDYLNSVIKKHELTRPVKENDRVRHIEALNSQTGPVFLTYKGQDAIDSFVEKVMEGTPDVDFTAPDGVSHTAWSVFGADEVAFLEKAFGDMDALYIADGHHRSAAAGRVFESRKGEGGSGHFLTVIFPDHQMNVLPYNRALKTLNGHSSEEILSALAEIADVVEEGVKEPKERGQVSFYINGGWKLLQFKDSAKEGDDPGELLDVALLQRLVLTPIFAIDDPRTSNNIDFIGGIRGTGELEKLVDSGSHACAFSMFATSVAELMAISDRDGLMPPKSTWFEPKLRDAMFCHMI